MSGHFMNWITAEKGGKGSGNFGHAGRPGKIGGSGEGTVAPDSKAGMLASVAKNAGEIVRQMKLGGFSFSPTTGFKMKGRDHGYMVALDKFEGEGFDKDTFGDKNLADFLLKHYRRLKKNPGLHIGGWEDDQNKVSVLDLSMHIVDLEEAKALGTKNKQAAIWDVFNGVEIRLDADAGRLAGKKKEKEDKMGEKKTKEEKKPVTRVMSNFGHGATLDEEVAEFKEMAKLMGLAVTPETEAYFRAELKKQMDSPESPE